MVTFQVFGRTLTFQDGEYAFIDGELPDPSIVEDVASQYEAYSFTSGVVPTPEADRIFNAIAGFNGKVLGAGESRFKYDHVEGRTY